jgi:DNA polymerase V
MTSLIALCDCNNFYVSCERVFRPDLIARPVAVLSNNDGCIVARSQEVKDLGIQMGVPLFKVQPLVDQHRITLFSSNYTLYADMSARVMSILEQFTPCLEVYSIDEGFLDLTGVVACQKDPIAYGQRIKKTVGKATGIPVCLGFGPTKTLAKLANYIAKKWKKTGGVIDLSDAHYREKWMKILPVGEVWGIGSRTHARLKQLGIHTVWDLAGQPTSQIRSEFNVVIARTVMELNGIACLDMEDISPNKQQIVCSRSFSRQLIQYRELSCAVSEFSTRVAQKLRQQHSTARCITVFIRTNPYRPEQPQYQRSASVQLTTGTQDTRVIINAALRILASLYRTGYGYQKAGVQLSQLQSTSEPVLMDLFESPVTGLPQENPRLMQTLDQINRRFPKSLSLASSGLDQTWQPKAERRSPSYTTDWNALVRVRC